LRLSLHYLNQDHQNAKALEALDSMESKIPERVIPMDYRVLYDVANFYRYAGATDKYHRYIDEVVAKLVEITKSRPREALGQTNPYTLLLTIYESREEYEKAIDVLNTINDVYGGANTTVAQQVNQRIAQLRAQIVTKNAITKDTVAVQPQRNK